MNQPTAIIVKDYMGRPENPYPDSSTTPLWEDFEKTVTEHLCPSIANTEPGKTVLAELQDQVLALTLDKYGKEYYRNLKPGESLKRMKEIGRTTRQIWVPIVEHKEGEGKPLPAAIQHLANAIDASGNKITFGLKPDQIALIESTLQEGFTTEYAFEKVAEQINWDKYTLVCWYLKHLRKEEKFGEWVSVEDRLPEVGKDVWVWFEDRPYRAHLMSKSDMDFHTFKGGIYWDDPELFRPITGVIYWQPYILPSPPITEK